MNGNKIGNGGGYGDYDGFGTGPHGDLNRDDYNVSGKQPNVEYRDEVDSDDLETLNDYDLADEARKTAERLREESGANEFSPNYNELRNRAEELERLADSLEAMAEAGARIERLGWRINENARTAYNAVRKVASSEMESMKENNRQLKGSSPEEQSVGEMRDPRQGGGEPAPGLTTHINKDGGVHFNRQDAIDYNQNIG